ncbi:MAG: hypothetical protein R3B45_16030 [Bdellovibrionota bacterium]
MFQMRDLANLIMVTFLAGLLPAVCHAGITIAPYYSVSSTKSITTKQSQGTETEKISQREEKGLKAGISFWRLFKLQLAVGQNFKTTTTTEQEITDEYDEIDFNSELDTSTRTPGKSTKIKDTQNKAKLSIVLDPGFWIFIARLKAGVTATQRKIEVFEEDQLISKVDPEPTYKPHAGVGLGIKFTRRMYGMIEYNFFFYKFPKPEPFEREAAISFAFSI